MTPFGRVEKRDTKVEKRLKKLGHWTYGIYLASIILGMIGVFYKCPCLTDYNFYEFYFQKFVQTILMGQFLAFWVFYNAWLPRNLYMVLHVFYNCAFHRM